MILHVNDLEELQEVIASNHQVVVDFSAPAWCVPCQRLAPHYLAASEKLADSWIFVEVDVDESQLIASMYGIMGVPTVKMFVDGTYAGDVKERTAIKLVQELT